MYIGIGGLSCYSPISFERELKRGRYVGRMVVVIEGTLADVCPSG
jgi:hypothetical protein